MPFRVTLLVSRSRGSARKVCYSPPRTTTNHVRQILVWRNSKPRHETGHLSAPGSGPVDPHCHASLSSRSGWRASRHEGRNGACGSARGRAHAAALSTRPVLFHELLPGQQSGIAPALAIGTTGGCRLAQWGQRQPAGQSRHLLAAGVAGAPGLQGPQPYVLVWGSECVIGANNVWVACARVRRGVRLSEVAGGRAPS